MATKNERIDGDIMGRIDYLLKQGWSKSDAEEYIHKLEEGKSPTEAYEHVRGGSTEVIDVKPDRIIEKQEYVPAKRSYRDEDISDYRTKAGLGSLIKETAKEITSFPGRKVREAVQDIRVGRVVRTKGREGRIKSKLFQAEQRGAEKEQREYENKLARQDAERKLNFEIQKIKALKGVRQSGKVQAPRRIRLTPIQRPKPVRRVSFYSAEGARAADPTGLYSISQPMQMQSQMPDMSHMNSLLGYNPVSNNHSMKRGKKSRKQKSNNPYSDMFDASKVF